MHLRRRLCLSPMARVGTQEAMPWHCRAFRTAIGTEGLNDAPERRWCGLW